MKPSDDEVVTVREMSPYFSEKPLSSTSFCLIHFEVCPKCHRYLTWKKNNQHTCLQICYHSGCTFRGTELDFHACAANLFFCRKHSMIVGGLHIRTLGVVFAHKNCSSHILRELIIGISSPHE